MMLSLAACSEETTISVNVENGEKLANVKLGTKALVEIGNSVYYDSATGIVYWWNGNLGADTSDDYETTPTPYYAPNGLPYRYNPTTNTFEEIDLREFFSILSEIEEDGLVDIEDIDKNEEGTKE